MEEMKIENEVATEETTVNEQEGGRSGLSVALEMFGWGALLGAGASAGRLLTENVIVPGAKKISGLFKNRKKKVSKEETNEDDYLYDENDEFEKADE